MIKKEVAVIGLGLAGETVGYGFPAKKLSHVADQR